MFLLFGKIVPYTCEIIPTQTSLVLYCSGEIVPTVNYVVNRSLFLGTFPAIMLLMKHPNVKPLLGNTSFTWPEWAEILQDSIQNCPSTLRRWKRFQVQHTYNTYDSTITVTIFSLAVKMVEFLKRKKAIVSVVSCNLIFSHVVYFLRSSATVGIQQSHHGQGDRGFENGSQHNGEVCQNLR